MPISLPAIPKSFTLILKMLSLNLWEDACYLTFKCKISQALSWLRGYAFKNKRWVIVEMIEYHERKNA